jgi:hypothetical protein
MKFWKLENTNKKIEKHLSLTNSQNLKIESNNITSTIKPTKMMTMMTKLGLKDARIKDDSSSNRSSITSSTSSSDADLVCSYLRSSATRKIPKSRAEICAESLREMNTHDMIAMLEMFAQHADNDLANDIFQKVKNSPRAPQDDDDDDDDDNEQRQVSLTVKKTRSFFPSFGRTQNA